jgi:hypothetical protein
MANGPYTFSERFMILMNLFDQEQSLPHDRRISLFEELLELSSNDVLLTELVLPDILKALNKYCEELTLTNNFKVIFKFEHIFSQWMHIPSRTIFHNPQNIHMFVEPAILAAKEILKYYPCKFNSRPFEHKFFDVIEETRVLNGINLPDLFASVWLYITKHKDSESLIKRLKEEMDECLDMCLSGHLVRLVNSVKGFDDKFEFNLEQFEYDKAFIFNQLSKKLDLTNLDKILDHIEEIVNKKEIDMCDVKEENILLILRDYAKHECVKHGDRYVFMR